MLCYWNVKTKDKADLTSYFWNVTVQMYQLTVGVPVIVAVLPRKLRDIDEWWEEIEQRPCDDHVVIYPYQRVDHQLTDSHTCTNTYRH